MRKDGALFKANFSGQVAVYRLYAANNVLLYVGQSQSPESRIATHRRSQPWNVLIEDWSVEWRRSRGDALAAELAAIRDERPLFNIDGNDGREIPWAHMVQQVGRTPLFWWRIPQFAEAAQHDLRLLDLLREVQGLRGVCGECIWPDLKREAQKYVGYGCGNPQLEDPRRYEAVISTLYESLPWSICTVCGAA